MYEEDWFMRQIKLVGEGIGMLLKKELSAIELGELELAEGQTVSREQLLLDYLEQNDYQQAFLLVNSLKYKLSVVDYNIVADWYINYLKQVPADQKEQPSPETIERYQTTLRDLL